MTKTTPVSAKNAHTEFPQLKIGKYTLHHITVKAGDPPYYDREDIWIGHENGEGMSVTIENMEGLIDGFYGENF